ncbi:MAG: DUF86 domain-containing protein [bacterium]|nr:DUF86 domain-containing protein [bacterium]
MTLPSSGASSTEWPGYLRELNELSRITLEEYLGDFRHRRAVERVVQLLVDAAVDVNTHILVDQVGS